MKKFIIGFIAGVVCTFLTLYILAVFLPQESELVTDCYVDDTTFVDTTLYISPQEMMKGVQGDFTLEQVDSMQREWARLDSIEAQKP